MRVSPAGVTARTFDYLQLGAGAIIKNFAYEAIETVEEFITAYEEAMQTKNNIGGTEGGIRLSITPTMYKRAIDGTQMVSFVGDEEIESWEVSMGADFVEFSPQVMQEAFPSAEFTEVGQTDSGILAMRIKRQVAIEDYANNHCLILGTKYGFVMFAMHDTLSRLSGETTTNEKGEAVLSIDISPKNKDFLDIENLPVEIWFIDISKNTIIKPEVI